MCVWNRTSTTGSVCSLTTIGASSITSVGNVKPDITFIVENPVASTLNSSKIIYLGPYADAYIKSGDSLIAKIKNLSTNFRKGIIGESGLVLLGVHKHLKVKRAGSIWPPALWVVVGFISER
jgi:hypothetical protein